MNEGLLEYSFEDVDFLAECNRESFDAFTMALVSLWPNRTRWTLLTPLPDFRDRSTHDLCVLRGSLCAAVLRSYDEFPGLDEAEFAYYSEANLVWLTRNGEAFLPERIRRLIDWEEVARPAG